MRKVAGSYPGYISFQIVRLSSQADTQSYVNLATYTERCLTKRSGLGSVHLYPKGQRSMALAQGSSGKKFSLRNSKAASKSWSDSGKILNDFEDISGFYFSSVLWTPSQLDWRKSNEGPDQVVGYWWRERPFLSRGGAEVGKQCRNSENFHQVGIKMSRLSMGGVLLSKLNGATKHKAVPRVIRHCLCLEAKLFAKDVLQWAQ